MRWCGALSIAAFSASIGFVLRGEAGDSTGPNVAPPTDEAAAVIQAFAGLENAGPDLVVGNIAAPWAGGNVVVGGRTIRGFGIGTTACNVGTQPLNWVQETPDHPVIAQAVYRISGQGRFEQIGFGWPKHSFCALQYQRGLPGNYCATCQAACQGCCSRLGVGCWDPYASNRNGLQEYLGPRSEINAFTGEFPFPYGIAWEQTGNAIYKRVQIDVAQLDPTLNPGAFFYAEAQYVARDDAVAGNSENNVSSRQLLVSGATPNFELALTGTFNTTIPAIRRWPVHVPQAVVRTVDLADEGRFEVGGYARDNGNGTWTYNYAVYNQNSHRAGYAFEVAIASGVGVSNIGMSFPAYHSGEPLTNAAWTGVRSGSKVRWQADATFAVNPNANAIRWGTAYTFWFTATRPPIEGQVRIETFRQPGFATALLPVPEPLPVDLADSNCDSVINVSDIGPFVIALTNPSGFSAAFPGCDILNSDTNQDGFVNEGDIGSFVTILLGQ